MTRELEYFIKLESLLKDLLNYINLQEPDKVNIVKFIDAGEYGLAFDELCATIADLKIPVNNKEFLLLKEIADSMNINILYKEQISTLINK